MTTYAEIINRLTQAAANVYEPREARSVALWAVESLTGADRMKLLVDPRATIESIDEVELARYERELAAARPIQYIIGATEFCGLQFAVGEGVLIPRPETELLVDTALDIIPPDKKLEVIDLCSGSGCIAI